MSQDTRRWTIWVDAEGRKGGNPPRTPVEVVPRDVTDEQIEEAAHSLYAGGPWGTFYAFADGGVRAITDAHSMDVYRQMVRDVVRSLR